LRIEAIWAERHALRKHGLAAGIDHPQPEELPQAAEFV
jgi:hypothetical protein